MKISPRAFLPGAFLALLGLLCAARPARAQAPERPSDEEELYQSASQLYQETSRDKLAAVEAYERFLREHAQSPLAADAEFMVGEAYLEQALLILRAEAASKKASSARLLSPKNTAAQDALSKAGEAFEAVVQKHRKKQPGLCASAQYRLGEVAYNGKDWSGAIERWRKLDSEYGKSYIVPEAWMGIVYAYLAMEQFQQAESQLFILGETYPNYLRVPEVLYAQGIVNLYKGDYANAEKALKGVNTPEALFYLGKTYLLSKRPFLAAAAFERLARDFPDSILREETEFFIGDSFFLAKDFDGAVTKYQRFLSQYPESQLKVSALFRIGSAHFQKRNYFEARAHFQSVVDRYPQDFFAPLAQYFIAESYLVDAQNREALFAYTKVITQHPDAAKIAPLAHYKLAWSQLQVGDSAQAAQTCRNFLNLYPAHVLAKNVYILLANALLQTKQNAEAVTALQRIIDLAPSSEVAEQALFTILQTQYQLRNYNSILTSYQFIFRHLPPSQSKWRSLSYLYAAEVYLALNRIDEAKAIYEMILKVYPNDLAAFYAQDGLAWSYAYLGEDPRALAERKKLKDMLAAVKSSFTFSGQNELGIADSMYNQKDYEEAYQLYEKFVEQNPGDPAAPQSLYRAGMSLYQLRYYTQAVENWRKLRERYPEAPETPKAEFQIADTLFRAQKYPEAVAAYRRILETYPDSKELPLAQLRLAYCAFNSKNDAGTLREAQTLLARFPDVPEATDALDLMEAVFDRSPLDFREGLGAVASAKTPAAADAQFRIARRFYEAKKYEDAAAEFQKFSVDHTGSPQLKKAQFLLAESYFNAGKLADSVFAFQRFLENFPKSEDTPIALFHLASAEYGIKEYEQAVGYYKRLLEEYPDSEFAKLAQYNLALAYKGLQKPELAQEAYARYVGMSGLEGAEGKAALWEIFAIQRERKDVAGALSTLERILGAHADAETMLEAAYRKGELFASNEQGEEAVRIWESLLGLSPKNNPFRLQGLIKLGEAYEAADQWARAAAVYDDLAKNLPSPQMAKDAQERAAAMRRRVPAAASGGGRSTAAPAPPADAGRILDAPTGGKKPHKPKLPGTKTAP